MIRINESKIDMLRIIQFLNDSDPSIIDSYIAYYDCSTSLAALMKYLLSSNPVSTSDPEKTLLSAYETFVYERGWIWAWDEIPTTSCESDRPLGSPHTWNAKGCKYDTINKNDKRWRLVLITNKVIARYTAIYGIGRLLYHGCLWTMTREKPTIKTVFPNEKKLVATIQTIEVENRVHIYELTALLFLTVECFRAELFENFSPENERELSYWELWNIKHYHPDTLAENIPMIGEAHKYSKSVFSKPLLEQKAILHCEWIRQRNALRTIVRFLRKRGTQLQPVYRIQYLREYIWKPRGDGELPPAARMNFTKCEEIMEQYQKFIH